jgi:competence protein ComEC
MSFAATTGLVAIFATMRERPRDGWRLPKWTRGAVTLLISSGIAGLATAPYGAAHFNQLAHYGLLANLISVPVMGLIVMPGAILAFVLAPVGLGWIGLFVMKTGLWWILLVAETISGWDGAASKIIAPGAWVLPLMTFGGLMLCIWRGRGRLMGLAPIMVAMIMWFGAERPDVLISDTGTLVGVMTPEGRIINREKGDGFVADSWLENDGDGADQATAALRGGLERNSGWIDIPGVALYYDLKLEATSAEIAALCRRADILVLPKTEGRGSCITVDRRKLRDAGSLSLTVNEEERILRTAREEQGARLWTARR